MKSTLLPAIVAAVICCSSAVAEDEGACETSANATLATEYVFRGQSQTLEEEAVQGPVEHPSWPQK